MNLLYLAQNGLSAAQCALNVVGNNLTNAVTAGYSRQNILLGEAGGQSTNYGFFGYGVAVDDVQRMYDGFLNNQVRGATTEFTTMQGRYQQVSQIDDMLGDDTNNISTTLGNMFTAMEGVSKNPTDPAARQGVLSQFEALANQFRTDSKTLNGLDKNTNTQISQSVEDINSCTTQLAKLNAEIEKIHGQTGSMPSDLLDKRDQLLNKLSTQIGIKVTENKETGSVNVSMQNGMSLVNGSKSYNLKATPSDKNSSQMQVAYIDATGNPQLLDEDATTGNLGGLFKFRNTDLVDARNQLNQLALKMASKFNEVNHGGFDSNGQAGGDIFSLDAPQATGYNSNSGSASLGVKIDTPSAVNAEDYTITWNGTSNVWEVKNSEGKAITPTVTGGSLSFDGITVTPTGTPNDGDSFTLNPASGAADSIKVAITDGDGIAASSSADTTDVNNNENIKNLIALKDENIVGDMTLTGAYANLVSSVGSTVSTLQAEQDTAGKACDQWAMQQQAVSGVDMNEEYVNLQMFSQYYQANAEVLKTANSLFDTLLSLK
ncbi:flagellar hook-associated protein FlgK [Escherichia sp. E3659]|uniref:flagellar hook-associated protein FlgK n=1 Tax=Escherichia sp. E3659 TaxID=2044462 RepID=UPI001081BA0E|nr:flagellar hook-associated protein FlgK [Escherichia sp. E3659]TGB81666.1 flagellar hook-associated protein FlgK [Escherichia sp. E3659]TLJ03157.1 flagellar hook-associated protein FlgK [Escherichia sp. E3659]